MRLRGNKHWRLWLIGLLTTVALAAKSYTESKSHTRTTGAIHVGLSKGRDSSSSAADVSPPRVALGRLKRPKMSTDSADLFRPHSWYVPPPAPPPAPPPVPTVPPLPFTFIGKVVNANGKLTIFLADKERVYLVHKGETLRHRYHVDGIKHGKLALTYIPLKKKQYLNLVEGR